MIRNRKNGIEQGFISDGCTCSPDFDIGYCCQMHDYLYWRGGKWGQKKVADKLLCKCIRRHGQERGQATRYHILAVIYYFAVRLAGWLFWRKKAR
jgi:hypothetical protein